MLKSKRLCVLTIIMCLMKAQFVFAAAPIKVFFNGREIVYDVPAQAISNHTMAPLSQTIQAITGSPADWSAVTKTVTFYANGHTNVHKIGERIVYVDGKPVYFDSASVMLNSRTLVPIRMIAETSGCQVEWDKTRRYVIITGKPSAHPVSIYSATASRTTVNEGEQTILTIRTNAEANYAWVEYSNRTENAKYVSTDSAGLKTWTAACYPLWTGQIIVHVNSENIIETAANQTVNITVIPKNSVVRIESISASGTSIYDGEATYLTIKTSLAVNNVWVEYDNTSVNAAYQSTDSLGIKTWRASCYPLATQHLNVYANTAKTTTGAYTDSVRVTVNKTPAPAPTPKAAINSTESWADDNLRVHVIVVTNTAVNQVDITASPFGTESLYAPRSTSSSAKTWSYYFDVPYGFTGSELTFSVVAYGENSSARDKTTAYLDSLYD